jgi:hypothetical protein
VKQWQAGLVASAAVASPLPLHHQPLNHQPLKPATQPLATSLKKHLSSG